MNKRTWTSLLMVMLIPTAVLCIGWGDKQRTTDDYVKIAAAGAGMVIDASGRDVNDLMKIAAVCGGGGGTLYLKHCGGIETMDLMKIAAAGSGHVTIEF